MKEGLAFDKDAALRQYEQYRTDQTIAQFLKVVEREISLRKPAGYMVDINNLSITKIEDIEMNKKINFFIDELKEYIKRNYPLLQINQP